MKAAQLYRPISTQCAEIDYHVPRFPVPPGTRFKGLSLASVRSGTLSRSESKTPPFLVPSKERRSRRNFDQHPLFAMPPESLPAPKLSAILSFASDVLLTHWSYAQWSACPFLDES